MKTKFMLTLLLAVLAGSAFAQVSGYVFGYTAGTYSELTGGTVLATATVGGTGTNSLDEGFYTGTPIPFPFHFNGLPYTETAVSCNGYIIMGGAIAMGYTPVSSTYVADGSISALGRDLQGNTDAGNLGEVRYQTLGNAPNRVWVVQWKNFRRYAGVGEDYNFQIRLHEGTDVIEFVYGEMLVTYTGTSHPQVGLRGVTNTDFTNRAVTADWAASTAGTNNTAMATLSTTVYPASGTTYNYTLTVTTLPNPASLIYPAVGSWTYLNGVLRWGNAGGYPSSYNVYCGESADPPYVANVTTLNYAPTLNPNTTYYWRIDAVNIFGVTTGTVWNFKTPTVAQLAESFENTEFPPVGWLNPNSWSRSTTNPYHLTAVASKSANTTPAVLSTPKVNITATSTLDFYYKPGSTNGYGRLQTVYSPDRQTWTPIGPLITMPTATTVWNAQSVDLGSIQGSYFLGFQAFTTSSTATIAIDHVFGPEITAEVPGPCELTAPADQALDASPLIQFSWTVPTTGGVPQGYKLYCDTNTDPTTLITTTTGYSHILTEPLLYGTTYYWKVVAYNGVGDSSPNTVRSFTTWADPTVVSFPWTESFDGETFAPIGWFNIKTAGTTLPGIWNRVTAGSYPTCATHSGAGMARYNSYSIQAGGKAELITPALDVPDGEVYVVEFWMFRDSGYATKTQEVVNVYVNTASTSVGGTLLGTVSRYYGFAPVEPVANLWYRYKFVFTGSPENKHIIFEAVSEYGNNMFIDDVTVRAIAAPAEPYLNYPAHAATGLSQDGFAFTWAPDLAAGDPPAYYVLYVASSEETIYDEYVYDNIAGTSFNPVTASEDPISYAFDAQYYWTVQAVNAAGNAVTDPLFSFSIQSNPFSAVPVVEAGLDGAGVVLNWAAIANANSYKVYGSDDPYGPWTLLGTTAALTYTYAGTENCKFFKVSADTHNP